MRPVNIPFDQHVGTQGLDATLDQRYRREAASFEQRNAFGAEPRRRHVELDVIYETFVPERGMYGGAALDDQALNAPPVHLAQSRAKSRLLQRNDGCTAVLQGRDGRAVGRERCRGCEYYHRSG